MAQGAVGEGVHTTSLGLFFFSVYKGPVTLSPFLNLYKKDLFYLFILCVCEYDCRCPWNLKRAPNPLEQELEAFVSHTTEMLGLELWSFVRAASAN